MEKRLEDRVDVDRSNIMQCGDVLVYTAGIHRLKEAGNAEFEIFLNRVPDWRRQRILSYRNPNDRACSLACSLLLAAGCAELGWDSQGYIGENGRPMFLDEGHYISLTHAGDYAAVAFSEEPVGIDVEEIRRFTPERMEKIGKKILTKVEREYLTGFRRSMKATDMTDSPSDALEIGAITKPGNISESDNIISEEIGNCTISERKQASAFARIWTRKEAYVKRNGKGLSMDFREIETMQEDLFYSCALGNDYMMSVCGSNLADIRELCI